MPVPAADDVTSSPFRPPTLEPATAARVLALNCARLSADDVRTLGAVPAPRVILIHGGVFPVHLLMAAFGRFLVGMGYPEASIRDPSVGDWSYSPYMDTKQLAGLVAWQYERDGMRPMMVGHSQGGLYVVKILKDLAGRSGDTLQVWNPRTWEYENRTSIVDPFTGKAQPVVGLTVAYGSAVGAGGFALLLPNQWESLDTLAQDPGYRRRVHGLLRRGRPDRAQLPRQSAGHPLRSERQGVRPQRYPARHLQPHHGAGGRRSAAGCRGARMGRGLFSGVGRRHVGAVAVGATSRAVRRGRLVQREEALVPGGEEGHPSNDASASVSPRRATRVGVAAGARRVAEASARPAADAAPQPAQRPADPPAALPEPKPAG